MRYKVPQNIDMPDRILGPLTMVQFIYAVIGFGLCYVIFMAIPAPVSYFLIVPIALFIVCLDFVKINERPFLDFFIAAVNFIKNPKKRVWHQGFDSDMSIEIYHAEKQTGPKIEAKHITHQEIEEVAKRQDTEKQILIKR